MRLNERSKNPVEENKRLFKMKRFQNVRGVVNTNRKPFKNAGQRIAGQTQPQAAEQPAVIAEGQTADDKLQQMADDVNAQTVPQQ